MLSDSTRLKLLNSIFKNLLSDWLVLCTISKLANEWKYLYSTYFKASTHNNDWTSLCCTSSNARSFILNHNNGSEDGLIQHQKHRWDKVNMKYEVFHSNGDTLNLTRLCLSWELLLCRQTFCSYSKEKRPGSPHLFWIY